MEEALIKLWRNMYMEKKVGSRFLEDYTLQSSFLAWFCKHVKEKCHLQSRGNFRKRTKIPNRDESSRVF